MNRKLQEYRTFLTRVLRQPTTVGAVLPTSRHAAAAVADVLPTTGTPTVLELGPGTGPLSEAIRQRLPEGSRHIAVEIDPEMVRYLRTAKPWLHVIEGDATNLHALLDEHGLSRVDAVISSIPWTLLAPEKQQELLDEVSHVLNDHGVFTAISYVTALWRPGSAAFGRLLRDTFDEVVPRSTVWRNTPPARVYVCRRPAGKLVAA